MRYLRFTFVAFFLFVGSATASFAQNTVAPLTWSFELLGGSTNFDSFSGPSGRYPLVAANFNATVAGFIVLGVEGVKAWTKGTAVCVTTPCNAKFSDPQTYFGVHGQIQVPVGRVRPFVGGATGSLRTCSPKDSCATASIDGGIRVQIFKRASVTVAGRRRTDDRYPDRDTPNRDITEYRAGLTYRIK